MKLRRHPSGVEICVAIVLLGLLPHLVFSQGSLTPPGPPGPTMLTLEQLGQKADQANTKLDTLEGKTEKRTPISTLPYTISQPGSYYVTQNLTATGSGGGITIAASNVTLDLNGFTLTGGNEGAVPGISVPSFAANIRVRNGVLVDWRGGGISASPTQNCSYEDLSVRSCQGVGILAGQYSTISNCRALSNSGGPGIQTGAGCIIRDCLAVANSTEGFSLGSATTITNCAAIFNVVAGIKAVDSSMISHCTADQNGPVNFLIGNTSQVIGNTATSGVGGGAIGFKITGASNRIDSNNAAASSNSAGYVVEGNGNLIIRNSARRTGNNQYPISGSNNTIGVIIDMSASGGTVSAGTPWSNFVY